MWPFKKKQVTKREYLEIRGTNTVLDQCASIDAFIEKAKDGHYRDFVQGDYTIHRITELQVECTELFMDFMDYHSLKKE